jgi:hypothetical protein
MSVRTGPCGVLPEASWPNAPLITERGWCTSPEAQPRP